MPRVLAIDYGKRRIGLAITDPEGKVAFPLETVDTKKLSLETYIEKLYKQKPFSTVIITKSPRKSLMVDMVFLECWMRRKFKVETILWDEHYTSSEAEAILKSMGIRITKKNKHLIDTMSAYIILCEYLGIQILPFNSS